METKDFRDSLSMIDSRGHRLSIIPAEVSGYFKKRKAILHTVLLFIFLALPWIKIDGQQSVRIDLANRQFHLLGLHLQAHDAPLIFFVLLAMTMALALSTALWGRVWCGWACPQTVFVESLFRRIEIWVEGNYIQRRRMAQGPFSGQDVVRKTIKWVLFSLVAFIISHSFLAYWTGSDELLAMMGSSPSKNSFYFSLVMAMTALVLFDFGWFREQFCLIVCPYGRVQSLLHDSDTKTVMYDEKRGEPRKGASSGKKGDCVSCQRCVQVCPTGIDIRNGIQMECIGCTACIDACDEIMRKVHKPEGLIRYKAMVDLPVRWFRPRVLVYSTLLLFSISSLVFILSHRTELRVELLRPKDVPFAVRDSDGQKLIQNHFKLRLENDRSQTLQVEVRANRDDIRLIVPENPIKMQSQTKKDIPIFVEIPMDRFFSTNRQAIRRVEFQIQVVGTQDPPVKKVIQLLGPNSQ